jgi:hypothetical protein
MAYLDHITRCNTWDPEAFRSFVVDGRRIGWVRHDTALAVADFPQCFAVSAARVTFAEGLDTPAQRTEALAAVAPRLVDKGAVAGLRGETYAIKTAWLDDEVFRADRGLVPALGLKAYGVHLSGYVRRADGGLDLWVGRRAADKATAPNKLDNLVAGGQPAGLSLRDNLLKEAAEEAAMSPVLANRAVSTGAITYCFADEAGLKPDTMYCYDIALPADFRPRNTDGEIAEFMLWPIETVLDRLRDSDDFKVNVTLVIIDFAIRHGVITPDDEPAYESLLTGLRGGHGGIGEVA